MQIPPEPFVCHYLCIGFSLRGSNTLPVRHNVTQNSKSKNALLLPFLASAYIYYGGGKQKKFTNRLLNLSGLERNNDYNVIYPTTVELP